MLSMHSEDTLVRQALDAGARGYILKNAMDLDLANAIKRVAKGEKVLDPQVARPAALKGEREGGLDAARARSATAHRRRKIEQGDRRRVESERKYGVRASREHHGYAWDSQDGGACGLCDPKWSGESALRRRDFLMNACAAGIGAAISPAQIFAQTRSDPGFHLTNVTAAAGIQFQHNSGAYGGKLLPETLGSGCAFLDYDRDGWQDILLVNGMDWPGHTRQRSTLKLYRNNRNGTFSDVTKAAGLDIELYGMGVAVGDYNNDGFPDIFISCVGQSRLFRNTGKGTFIDVTKASGLLGRQALSTSALWFDYDRDGLLDLFVCNYVRWSPEHDVFCSLDGTHKSYCTPEAYRGDTCWLFHNRGDGTFEDVTASSGIFDSSSKSLGVAMFDYDQDGWPDLLVANDTQPNKLYKNLRNGKFKDVGVEAGMAFSTEGKARAGMGVDTGDFENSGKAGVAITNFDNEMIGLYHSTVAGPAGTELMTILPWPPGWARLRGAH